MDYFDIPALSASGINAFYKSPLHFWVESPFNPDRVKREETPAMLFGKVAHKLVLERDTFLDEFAISQKFDRRTTKGKEEAAQFEAENAGKVIIDFDMFDQANDMAEAVMRHQSARTLLFGGEAEKPIMWKNGINCKGKLDCWKQGLILDYKTVASAEPEDFKKSILNFGYHRQAAWYMDGVERVTGERPKGFVFIIQEKTLPDAVGVRALDEESLRKGHEENMRALEQITERLETGNWRAYPDRIETTSLPAWYLK